MTHNSLSDISVTDATLHELRGWLKAIALENTVHQYKGKKHTKETTRRVRSHEHSRHLEREGAKYEREGEAERSILMTHNSLRVISVTDETFHEWRGWLKAFAS